METEESLEVGLAALQEPADEKGQGAGQHQHPCRGQQGGGEPGHGRARAPQRRITAPVLLAFLFLER